MEPPTRNSNPVTVYNPLKNDFTVTYATDDGPPLPYTVPSLDTATFPSYIADHVKKHLAQAVLNARGIRNNYDDDFREAVDEISVNYDL